MNFTVRNYIKHKDMFTLNLNYDHSDYGPIQARIAIKGKEILEVDNIYIKSEQNKLPEEEFLTLLEEIRGDYTIRDEAKRFLKNYLNDIKDVVQVKDVFVRTADTQYIRSVSRTVSTSFDPSETTYEKHLIKLYILTAEKEEGYPAKLTYNDKGYKLSFPKQYRNELMQKTGIKGIEKILLKPVVALVKEKVNFLLPECNVDSTGSE